MHPFHTILRKAPDQMTDAERCAIASVMILSTTQSYEKLTPEETFDALVLEYRNHLCGGATH